MLRTGVSEVVLCYRPHLGFGLARYDRESGFIAEKAAKPGSDFKECANGCPTMIVVPAGKFMMGSPDAEGNADECPQHE
jgi:formylglycine-generating enzyme required for sulfatase activity